MPTTAGPKGDDPGAAATTSTQEVINVDDDESVDEEQLDEYKEMVEGLGMFAVRTCRCALSFVA